MDIAQVNRLDFNNYFYEHHKKPLYDLLVELSKNNIRHLESPDKKSTSRVVHKYSIRLISNAH